MSRLLFASFQSQPAAVVAPTVTPDALGYITSSGAGCSDYGDFNGRGRRAWVSRARLIAGR